MHPILFLINVTDPSSLPNILDPTFPLPVPSLLNLCLWAPPYLESKQEMQKHIYLRLLTWKCPSDGQRQWTWPLSEESETIEKVRVTRAAFAEIKIKILLYRGPGCARRSALGQFSFDLVHVELLCRRNLFQVFWPFWETEFWTPPARSPVKCDKLE